MGIDFVDDLIDDAVDFVEDVVDDVVDFVQEGLQSLFDIDIPEPEKAQEGVLVTKVGAVEHLPLICGTRRVGGTLIFAEVTGTDNEHLWLVYAIADGDTPCSSILSTGIRVNGLPWSDAKYTGLLANEITTGGHTSQPFTTLQGVSAVWTSGHKLLGTAAMAVRFTWDKEAFSGIPKVDFQVVGTQLLDLDVLPTETRRASSNPAEFLFEYLTNDIVGKGLSKVDGVDIDLQSFKDARDYCNDSVTSYSGGPSHTRMTCDLVIDPARKVSENITTILQTCRGSLPLINGVFHLVIEKHYTPADYGRASYFDFNIDNVIGGWSFKSGDVNARYNRVKVTFPNEDLDYKSDFVAVESATFRAEDGRLLEKAVSLAGTTNVYRAIDTASVFLRRSRQQILTSFVAIPEARQVTVGEIVTVTHPTPGWTAKQFRVTRMTLLRSGNCSVTLSEHEETVYDLSVPNEVNTAADTNLPDPSSVPTLTGLTLVSDETVLKIAADGTLVPQIHASWTIPSNIFVNGYDVEFKLSADSIWLAAGSPNSLNTDELFIPNVVESSNYDVRVRARNSGGFSGAWATVSAHTVIGKTSKPTDVPWFQIDGQRVTWGVVTDRDLAGYQIRFQFGDNPSWGDAANVNKGLLTETPYVLPIGLSGPITLMIKAVDTSKLESENAAVIITNFGDPVVSNVLLSIDDHAGGFPGTLTDATVEGGSGDFIADSQTPLMWANSLQNMWTNDNALQWATVQYSESIYERTLTPASVAVGSEMVITRTIVAEKHTIEYRPQAPGGMWADDLSLMWSGDSNDMWSSPPDYQQWPGRLAVLKQPYDFRFTLGQGEVEGRISVLSFDIDVPDINESLGDVSILSGGTRLSLTKTFDTIKVVNLTLQDDGGSARTVRVIDKSISGPLVQCFDSSGVATAGEVDAIIQGY